MVKTKLAKYDELDAKQRALEEKVNQDELIQAQVYSLIKSGVLKVDDEGNVSAQPGMSAEKF